jgi:hypothetical protein
VRCPLLILPALFFAPLLSAEPAEKPLGRSQAERFGSPIQQKDLTFNTRQGAVGDGQTYATRSAQTASFNYDQKVSLGKYETREFSQPKTSWLSKLKFWAKDAPVGHEVPNAGKQFETSSAQVKEARDAGKTMAVRDLSDGGRTYLGPERAKLDKSIDPNKPLPGGWQGEKLEPLSVEQVRELLNKNK